MRELLPPGEVAEITVNLIATANVFRAGHRIRLEVAASNWPRFDRQLADRRPDRRRDRAARRPARPSSTTPARPSRLHLPIVPA